MSAWFTADLSALLTTVLSGVGIYAVLIVLVRVVGLRSFSKMTSVDFAVTIATGSVLASAVLTSSPSLPRAAVAMATLFGIQFLVSWARKRTAWAETVFDNEPLILMTQDGMVLENLKTARVTENDIWSKLREANVLTIAEVRAVVFEATGDISVLHGDADGPALEACLLSGVRDASRVATVDHGNAERYA